MSAFAVIIISLSRSRLLQKMSVRGIAPSIFKSLGNENNVNNLNKQGVTIILTTNYLFEAQEMSDRIAILNKGDLVAHDTTKNLLNRIKTQIRINASPRHVPSKVIVVKDIPRTKSGKIVELAVKSTIEGSVVKNKEALANPEVLKQYKNLKQLSY